MGQCLSNDAEAASKMKVSRQVDRDMRKDADNEESKIKLLLLGAGESGKSTVFKQMKLIYGVGFSESERQNVVPMVYSNILLSMKALLEACDHFGIQINRDNESAKAVVLSMTEDHSSGNLVVDKEISAILKRLWADSGVQQAYVRRSEFQLSDSTAYFFDRLDAVSEPNYIVTQDDILHVRIRTSGLIEERFVIEGVEFKMFDVGGQRNERRKWIHLFDGVTACIFVAAMSEYDQVMFEDPTMNRLDDALELFREITGSRYFRDTSMILFLNKKDLFEEKLKHTTIAHHPVPGVSDHIAPRFQDCPVGLCKCGLGYPSPEPCTCGVQKRAKKYILDQFLKANDVPKKKVYHHITYATDSSNVKHVFSACTNIILRGNLSGSGFLE